jgi:tRNA(Ile)-lysidine synthase
MLIDKVKSTVNKYSMLQKDDRILVGLSGGPDSITLLYVLNTLKKEYKLEIYIAHLDHKFRGEESRKDREFCEGIAKKLKLEIVCEEIDVQKIADEKGISPEEAARLERYDFFRRVARERSIKKLAVGHTKDDQAETVLMRAIRGAGMLGLGGMRPVKYMQGMSVIRPLIEISRSEVEDFIRLNKLEFRHDSSNDKIVFTRNRIRQELLPYLEKNFNSNIKDVLANMAENLRIENEFLEKFSARKFKAVSSRKNCEISIDLKRFKKQPEAIQKRILRVAICELKGDLRRLTYQHWKEMEALVGSMPTNAKVDLPAGINVVKKRDSISISVDNSARSSHSNNVGMGRSLR